MPHNNGRDGASVLKWPGPRRKGRDDPGLNVDPGDESTRAAESAGPAELAEPTEHDRPPKVLSVIVDEIRTIRQRQRATELVLVMFASLGPQFRDFAAMLDRMTEEAEASPSAAEHPGFNEALHDAADTARAIGGGGGA